MKKIISTISAAFTVAMIAFILWILVSWVNVVAHNSPCDDGEPADWNAFVVFVEACNE